MLEPAVNRVLGAAQVAINLIVDCLLKWLVDMNPPNSDVLQRLMNMRTQQFQVACSHFCYEAFVALQMDVNLWVFFSGVTLFSLLYREIPRKAAIWCVP